MESQYYQLGRRYTGQQVRVRCDASARAWVFSTGEGIELARWAVKSLDAEQLTGLSAPLAGSGPQQLALPGWANSCLEAPIQLARPGWAA